VSYAYVGSPGNEERQFNVDQQTAALFDPTLADRATRGIVEVLLVIALEPLAP
jgi:hypothetical protein